MVFVCVNPDLDELEEMEVVGERDAEGEERDLRDYRQQLEADSEMRKSVRTTEGPALH